MKNKRFIAKLLVLAMVFALMIPTPVLAAAKGGKLVKSVTEYRWNVSKNRWEKDYSSSYTYNKKNYPKEIKTYSYEDYIMGIPMGAEVQIGTYKYKFKGKLPKSMKLKNTSGRVVETRKYKKGRLVSWNRPETYDYYNEDNGNFDKGTGNGTVTYNKKGLATSRVSSSSRSYKYTSYSGNRNETYTTTYAVTHKKGIPSQIVASQVWTESFADSDGDSGSDSSKTPYVSYTKFNGKGLTIESGSVEQVTNLQKPSYKIQYKMKKGAVKEAVVYSVKSDGSMTPFWKYTFKYTKKKISKARYFNMVNSVIGFHNAQFSWY